MADVIKAAVLKKYRSFHRLYEEGNYEELWDTIYLPEGICYPPQEEPCNKAKYVALMVRLREDPGISRWESSNTDVIILSEVAAVATSKYRALDKDGVVLRQGNSLTVFQKRDSEWFIQFNMHNIQ